MKRLLILSVMLVAAVAFAAKYDLKVSGTHVKSFEVTCGTSATPIEAGVDAGHTSFVCGQLSSAEIFIGGSDVNTSTAGFPICSNAATCLTKTIELSANNAYCVVASGSETLDCIAVVE